MGERLFLALDEAALTAAKSGLDDGAVTPHNAGPWVKDIIDLQWEVKKVITL